MSWNRWNLFNNVSDELFVKNVPVAIFLYSFCFVLKGVSEFAFTGGELFGLMPDEGSRITGKKRSIERKAKSMENKEGNQK